MIGLEASWTLHVPKDTIAKGEWIYQWSTYPVTEELWDDSTQSTYTQTTNYSIACAIQAGMDAAMVMNFEGPSALNWDSSSQVKMLEQNLDDLLMPDYDGTDTMNRRMLKGKKRRGKRGSRKGKTTLKKARKQKRRFQRNTLKKQKQAQKHWETKLNSDNRRKLAETEAQQVTYDELFDKQMCSLLD